MSLPQRLAVRLHILGRMEATAPVRVLIEGINLLL
jgi:hypothetical protein